ncbi:MAG: CCA tRNA nucleotidyltransferase [Candidatus Phytoplasma australasiaticum]|nr:CCA tRNA nucleotidyltransferase [Candidatus Phytoplasma australasiaticum]
MLNFKLYMDKAKKILKILKKNKAEAFVVGGAVRDFLLKKPITDVDITTNLLPEDVCEIFDIPKRRIRYGSVKIYFENNYFEITTYRKEAAYLDFRHPSCIIFIQHIKDDLQRRDFTINGLLLDENDKIFDYVGGIKDLNNKIIRIIGNPYQKLTEDPLRMLRIFYFKAKLNFSVEENAEKVLKDNIFLISKLPVYLLFKEFNKILKQNFVNVAFNYLLYTKAINYFKSLITGILFFIEHKLENIDADFFLVIAVYLNDQVIYDFPLTYCQKMNIIKSVTLLKQKYQCLSNLNKFELENLQKKFLKTGLY